MSYTKNHDPWGTGAAGGTPVTATKLDNFETGHANAHKVVDAMGGNAGTYPGAVGAAGRLLRSLGNGIEWTDRVSVDASGHATVEQNLQVKGQGYSPTHVLTDGASIAVNADLANVFRVTLGGNRSLANPTNLKDGATYIFIIKQDATGGRTLTFGTAYKFPGGIAPSLTTAANAVDILSFVSDGTNLYGNITRDLR